MILLTAPLELNMSIIHGSTHLTNQRITSTFLFKKSTLMKRTHNVMLVRTNQRVSVRCATLNLSHEYSSCRFLRIKNIFVLNGK
ncbi:hypothetical protein RDWZM_003158, partial [Blomia tropicalis]